MSSIKLDRVMLIIALVFILSQFLGSNLADLVPFGQTLDFTLQNGNRVRFHTSNEYYIKNGCSDDADCGNINACEVDSTVLYYEDTCPVSSCEATGFRNCHSSMWRDRCQYGNTCSDNDAYWDECSDPNDGDCEWISYPVGGETGGINYDEVEGCSWYFEVLDPQGNVIETHDESGFHQIWDSEPYSIEPISFTTGNANVFYRANLYGVGSHGYPECLQVEFEVIEDGCNYQICIGNDAGGLDCEDSILSSCDGTPPDGGGDDSPPPENFGIGLILIVIAFIIFRGKKNE